MIIEFTQNGIKRVLKTPRNTKYSNVVIKNLKSVILVVVRKKCLIEKRQLKLKQLGESLMIDQICLNTYYIEKEKVKNITRRKKIFKIKVLKDKASIVKIQNFLF